MNIFRLGSTYLEIMIQFDVHILQIGLVKNHPTKVETVKEAAKSDRFGPDFESMPTLRKFIRFNDWQRVEKIFQKVVASQMEGEGGKSRKKHYTLRSPLLPGIFFCFGDFFFCEHKKNA